MKPLKPVMAALLAAASATFALPGISHANTPQPAGAPAGQASSCSSPQTDSLAILTCLVAQDRAVQEDIGKRLARFVLSKDAKGDYSYLLIRDDKDLTFLGAVGAAAQKWPSAGIDGKGSPGDVAVLYFVLGPDDGQPAWAKANPVLAKTLAPGMKWNGRLQTALDNAGWTKTKKMPPTAVDDGGLTAFLNAASAEAMIVFKDQRTVKEIADSTAANDTTAVKSTTIEGKSPRLDGTGSGFGFDDLYKTGAEVENVYGPHDNGFRTLSMKVYTTKDADGNLINQIGIVDITPDDISSPSLPKFVDVSHAGDTEIILRDGGRHYTVTVGTDGKVTLKRPGGSDQGGAGGIASTINGLSAKRDEQIMGRGKVMIDGQPYYVLGQGGQKGSYLFFSQAEMDASPTGNAHPALMGDVAQVLSDGSSSPIRGAKGPDLGKLPNGTAWHLEFDMASRMWKVAKGEGDKKPGKGGDTPPSDSTGTAKGKGSGAGASDTPLLSALVTVKYADYKDHDGTDDYGNGTINEDMKDQFKVMTDKDGKYYVVSPALPAPAYTLNLDGNPTFRAFNKWVAVVTDADVLYYDLPALAAYSDPKAAKSASGRYAKGSNEMIGATDIDVADDILTTYLKKDIDLKPGVAKYAPEGSYRISAKSDGDKFIVTIMNTKTKKSCIMSPDLGMCVDDAGNTSETAKAPGQAADPDGAPKAYTGCRAQTTEPDGKTVVDLYKDLSAAKSPGDKQDHDVCLYVHQSDPKHPAYTLTLNYTTENKPTYSTAFIFGEALPKPAQFFYKSTLDKTPVSIPTHPEIRSVAGSDAAHGVYGLFQSGDSTPNYIGKDKAGDCLGVVVWWGFSEADALKACQERVIPGTGSMWNPLNWFK